MWCVCDLFVFACLFVGFDCSFVCVCLCVCFVIRCVCYVPVLCCGSVFVRLSLFVFVVLCL